MRAPAVQRCSVHARSLLLENAAQPPCAGPEPAEWAPAGGTDDIFPERRVGALLAKSLAGLVSENSADGFIMAQWKGRD